MAYPPTRSSTLEGMAEKDLRSILPRGSRNQYVQYIHRVRSKDSGTPLRPKYIPYIYVDPLGLRSVKSSWWWSHRVAAADFQQQTRMFRWKCSCPRRFLATWATPLTRDSAAMSTGSIPGNITHFPTTQRNRSLNFQKNTNL